MLAPRKIKIIVAVILGIGCVILVVPFSPSLPDGTLDSSWIYAINTAVAKHLIFGHDIIFTLGPYASTYTKQYHPETDTQMVWSSGLLALALAVGFFILARDRYKLSALSILPFLALNLGDPLYFCIPMVFIIMIYGISVPSTHFGHLPLTKFVRCGLTLLVVACSILTLIKGTFGIAAVAVMIVGCAVLAVRGERMQAVCNALLFLLSISTFWVVAGQPLERLPTFFAAQAQIVAGYSDAMSVHGTPREPIIYVLACCVIGLCHFSCFRSGGLPAIAFAAGVTPILFIAFKTGFVRHDAHAIFGGGVVGLTAWILSIAQPGLKPILALAFCLVSWGVIDRHFEDLNFGTIKDRIVWPFIDSSMGLVNRVTNNEDIRQRFNESVSAIRREYPLPPLRGTVDIYSFGQSVLLANALDWAPRPVLQSYSAYTADLLEKDAAYLASSGAPDNILFSIQPIDGRLGALEDGLSWPALLTRYSPAALVGSIAILHRKPEPTTHQVLRDLLTESGAYHLGAEIALPLNADTVWAKVEVNPTSLGKLFALAYKLPELTIELNSIDGRVRRFRYIAGMGKTGFLVSPLVLNASDFVALQLPKAAGYFATRLQKSMKISTDGNILAQWVWSQDLRLQLFRMDIPSQAEAATVLFKQAFVEGSASDDPERLTETNDCDIEHLNDYSAGIMPKAIKGTLQIDGWAAMSIEDGAAPDQTRVILTDEYGRKYLLAANLTARADLKQHFGKLEMGDIGFEAVADISKFRGIYTLGIQVYSNGETRECAKHVVLDIGAIHPD